MFASVASLSSAVKMVTMDAIFISFLCLFPLSLTGIGAGVIALYQIRKGGYVEYARIMAWGGIGLGILDTIGSLVLILILGF